jgi:hypothetical protein
MIVFRSMVLGLLGACLILLARRPVCELRVVETARPAAPVVAMPASIVDVAPGVAPSAIGALLRLAPDEHVAAVGERAVASDLEAGELLAAVPLRAGGYVDLTVARPGSARRVLVLLH